MATDKTRHLIVKYLDDSMVQRALNCSRYRHCEQLDIGQYEVQLAKQSITYDLPNVISFFVYCYAKQAMLSFVYDFMTKFFTKRQYQFLQMDTVSFFELYIPRYRN